LLVSPVISVCSSGVKAIVRTVEVVGTVPSRAGRPELFNRHSVSWLPSVALASRLPERLVASAVTPSASVTWPV
jgi:hypothetical protein